MTKGLTDTKFLMGLQAQRHWDWKVAFYLYGAGTSAGLIFLEVVFRGLALVDQATALWGMWIGLALALLSLAFLFDHLGPGARWSFLYVFKRARTSWIARGAIIVTVLVFLRIMVLLPSLPGLEGLPWKEGTVGGALLRAAVLLFAVAFMAYSGLVLSSWNSIAFWNTPLLPILYIAYSFLAGMAALLPIEFLLVGKAEPGSLGVLFRPALLILLFVNGFLLLLYLWGMATATLPARESVRRLVRGERCKSFWLGIVGVGLVLPITAMSLVVGGKAELDPATLAMVIVACGAIQVGGFLLRDNFLRVGVYGYPV